MAPNTQAEPLADLEKNLSEPKEQPGKDDETQPGQNDTQPSPPPKGLRFALSITSIFVMMFTIGYDTSCIATLIPVITDHYHSLQDLGWYTVAYLLTQSATMLIYGQLYCFFSMKTLFLGSVLLFIGGSILTAAAPTSPAFIVGRALNGLGCAGALAGNNIIIAHTTSLKSRPTIFAIAGGVETAALAFGPLISGALAHATGWRVAFWITVPLAATVFILVFFTTDSLRQHENAHLSSREALQRIDWLGFGITVVMTLCLVLGLQWGGTFYPWDNWRVILLLVLAGVLALAFLHVQNCKGEDSMVPLSMLRNRSVAFASLITFCNFAHLALAAYYLPIYFQAIQAASTFTSGIKYLPLAVALGIAVLASGPLVGKLGYYNPVLIFGTILMTIGAGLISTWTVDTSAVKWISYQMIYAFGIGVAFQPPYIAVQTVLKDSMVPRALVMLSYMQTFGGIVMLSIAQNVFLARLTMNLSQEIPGLEPSVIHDSGALGVLNSVSASERPQVLAGYMGALRQVYYIILALCCVAAVSSLGIEWKSVKKEQKK